MSLKRIVRFKKVITKSNKFKKKESNVRNKK